MVVVRMKLSERIKQAFKDWLFMVTHPDPNSVEALRYRADRLVKKHGLSYQHPAVTALLIQADLKESAGKTRLDWAVEIIAWIVSLGITALIAFLVFNIMV